MTILVGEYGRWWAMKRTRFGVVTVVLLAIAGVGLVGIGGSASATTPKYSGDALGGVTCTLAAKVLFSPSLTTTGGGTNPSIVKGKLTGCVTNTPAVTISIGKVTGSFTSSPINCSTLTSTGVQANLAASWKGAVNGIVDGTSYAGKASFSSSAIQIDDEAVITDTNGHEGLALPGSVTTNSSVSGSFGADGDGGHASGDLYSSDSAATLSSLCSAKGLKKLSLTGTIMIGEPNWPTSITATANGGDQAGLTDSYSLSWTLTRQPGCDVLSCDYELSSEFSGTMTGTCCDGYSQTVNLPDDTPDHTASAEVEFSLGDDGQYHVIFSADSEEGPYLTPAGGADVIGAISNTMDEQAAAVWNENSELTLPGGVDLPGGSATFDFHYA